MFYKKIPVFIFLLFISLASISQVENNKTKDSIFKINKKNEIKYNTWAIGAGISQLIMHGDFRSLGTLSGEYYLNPGAYVYVDKMFNPILGVELKLNYSQLGASGQYISEGYPILYVGEYQGKHLHTEGDARGFEANLIVDIDNLWKSQSKRWNFALYGGVGYHQYTSKLVVTETGFIIPEANFAVNSRRDGGDNASSIYLSAGLGLKYRLNNKIDLDFRTTINVNNEDHLDAAISQKQTYESFFVTGLGVSFKLGEKEKYAIWYPDENVENKLGNDFELVDTDNDGVEDLFDKEPDTPAGAEVYGSGIAIDSDKDGLQDYKDNCPLVPGPIDNLGCPIEELKPIVELPIVEEPKEKEITEDEKQKIIKQITLLSKSIYFETASDELKTESYRPLNEISDIMLQYPRSKYKIEGHTDNRGDDNYNLDLSNRRARSVFNYLTSKGIVSGRLSSKGFGEAKPAKTNDTDEGRQYNRRVEINFIDPESNEGRLVYDKGVSFTKEIEYSSNAVSQVSTELLNLNTSKLTTIIEDQDGDGVPDLYDKEPDTPLGVKVYGNGVAMDIDEDGIPDFEDRCPMVYGLEKNQGCPEKSQEINSSAVDEIVEKNNIDTDGDGVADIYDKEPNTPQGTKVYGNGVSVDSDDDGLPDYIDNCPFEKGTKANNGCSEEKKVIAEPVTKTLVQNNIDTDGDGVADIYDKEPNTPQGTKVYGNGVSVDSDDDGLPDYIDNCPFEKGTKANNGCSEEKKVIAEPVTKTLVQNNIDTDGDGVPDIYDKEPNTPQGTKVYGNGVSVDSDDDGVADNIDNCPFEKGTKANYGCPKTVATVASVETIISNKFVDTDGDGVLDMYDKEPNTNKKSRVYGDGVSIDSDSDGVPDYIDDCPFEKGTSARKGCPVQVTKKVTEVAEEVSSSLVTQNKKDSDGDGVADVFDKEPNTPVGVKVYANGVAIDSDKDGLPDYKDRCPLVAGEISNNGCPVKEDLDGDGIIDSEDLCPSVKGTAENNGCPNKESLENVGDQLNTLASTIKFDRSEGHILKSHNLAILSQIADIMNTFKAIKFKVEVHTSAKPSLPYNLELSRRRAYAINKYLVEKGITQNRLEVEGLGGANLKYLNEDDKVEYEKNNRVEIKEN